MLKTQIIYSKIHKLFKQEDPQTYYCIYGDNKNYMTINARLIQSIQESIRAEIHDEDEYHVQYMIYTGHFSNPYIYHIGNWSKTNTPTSKAKIHSIKYHAAKTGKPTSNDMMLVYNRTYIQGVSHMVFRITSDYFYILRPIYHIIDEYRNTKMMSNEEVEKIFMKIDRALPDKEYIEQCRLVGIEVQIIDQDSLKYLFEKNVKLKIQL